ncbi:hypothetical protein HYT26_03510 [Candidatus Pacearchaeota archaeon]|nr:hypothetical protein [Candidatus Pacearchaeota archaeon]
MASRKKRLIKQIDGLIKQAEKHKEKIETEKGEKDTTPAYWAGEKERYEKQAEERAEILKKLKNKR